jgi:hypothetical protein
VVELVFVAAPKRPPPVLVCGVGVAGEPKSPVPAGLAPKRPPVAMLLVVDGLADALPEPKSGRVAAGCEVVPLWRV